MQSAAAQVIDFQEFKAKRDASHLAIAPMYYPQPMLTCFNGYWFWAVVL